MSLLIAKSATDELYYVVVNGQTEILSQEAAYRLADTLLALLGAEDYTASVAPSTETKH